MLRGDGIESGSIGPATFPLQICSLSLYLFPFVAFGRKDSRASRFLFAAAFSTGMMGGVITVLYPANVLAVNDPWLIPGFMDLSLISVLFHTTMLCFVIYMLVSKIYSPKADDTWKAIVVFLGCAAVAVLLNFTTPGADFMLLGRGKGVPLAAAIQESGRFVYVLVMLAVYSFLLTLCFSGQIAAAVINKIRRKPVRQ
jgi:hypothetical protein